MTRRILFVLLAFCGLAACDDDNELFDMPVPNETITFEPISGGAIMRYALPKNTGICAICARYVDALGENVTVLGTPFTDSIVLTGFNAPRTDVPVSITLTDNNDVESAPVERTFNTLASAPYAYIDSVEVFGSWGCVLIESSYTGSVSGIVDVYRVGINPFTKEIDTLFIQNFSIQEGSKTTSIPIASDDEETTIVLKTEDANGNYVRTKVVSGLRQYEMELYPRENLSVSDPGGFSIESPNAYGVEYLLDGDKTGVRCIEAGGRYTNYFTYLTYVEAMGSYVQLELQERHVIATVRLYGRFQNIAATFLNGYISNYLPCHVKVFGSNDPDLPMEQWVEIADTEWPRDADASSCWYNFKVINTTNPDDYKNQEPYYGEVVCNVDGAEYKYIRVMTLDHFQTYDEAAYKYGNTMDQVSYQELEVYVKAE